MAQSAVIAVALSLVTSCPILFIPFKYIATSILSILSFYIEKRLGPFKNPKDGENRRKTTKDTKRRQITL